MKGITGLILSEMFFFSTANLLMADGKVYIPDKIPLEIPYQRALVVFDGGTETLLLQSKYRVRSSSPATFLGWVVPVPAVPVVASMETGEAEWLFMRMGRQTRLEVVKLWHDGHISSIGGIVFLAAGFLFLIFSGMGEILPSTHWVKRRQDAFFQNGIICLAVGVVFWASMSFFHLGQGRAAKELVDILETQKAGIYDVQVVKGKDPKDLIQWLNSHQFHFEKSDGNVFGQYIKQGWCFVVATVRSSKEDKAQQIEPEALVDPLVLRFPIKQAVYPLALTATMDHETQIDLYVLSEKKVQCDAKLKLFFAGDVDGSIVDGIQTRPEILFSKKEKNLSCLTVFKGKLTPEQMRQDAHLPFALDNEPYRETKIEW